MSGRRCLGLAVLLSSACATHAPGWSEAQAMWRERRPHAWQAWQRVAAGPDGAEAESALRESARLYDEGILAFERGDEQATARLRHAAEIGPIEPSLYLRLARACRAQGANMRAIDFYRKLLVEVDGSQRDIAARELAQIDRDVGDPFETPERRLSPWLALVAVLPLGALALLRRRRVDLARVLERYPERAAAFAYEVGVLRHELFKHALRPYRDGARAGGDALLRAWRRHIEGLGRLLGLRRGWVRREPRFAEVDRVMRDLANGRGGDFDAVDRLEKKLLEWVRLARHTRVDVRLLDGVVESLRDENADRTLAVELVLRPSLDAPTAAIFEHDLALVLRNLLRNAIVAAGQGRLLVEVHVFVDDTGREWVRIGVHDPVTTRPTRHGLLDDRGLGIVRRTLERYDGALLDGEPATGFAKALVISIPAAEESAAEADLHAREAA